MTTTPRVKLPKVITTGETIEVKALVRHPMEHGRRKDAKGRLVPQNIIHSFSAMFEGRTVFRAEFGTGISANPFISFFMRVPGPGTLELIWRDDSGAEIRAREELNVVS